MASPEQKRKDTQLVVFRLAEGMYGVDIGAVKEIVTWQPVTPLPDAPEGVEGVINLRGRLIPIINLRKRLGFNDAPAESESKILVVEHDDRIAGLLVDGVSEVKRVSADQIETTAAALSGTGTGLLLGIVKSDDGLIVILEPSLLQQTAAAVG